jgi:hypothetical protein
MAQKIKGGFMEVKLVKSLAEWQEIYGGVQALMQESLPFKEAYWLARNADRIETAVKHLDAVRLKILEEMADKDEAGKPIMIETPGVQGQQFSLKENWAALQISWADVVNQEETIEIRLLSLEKIGEKLETIKPAILKMVMPIFEKEEETK